ncbi:hypothetical protein CPB83DRAFT_900106 [Crepidotus variabilis]|uniref:Protein kinase domain-containing protein n=1 Tax=Crepidotus variabilis TaxID=179855 RepID=A0A9P6E3P9_9AGAR|nr:hypothetical protein CPB83DRAFT_900106 [Crepidotus variabilis]
MLHTIKKFDVNGAYFLPGQRILQNYEVRATLLTGSAFQLAKDLKNQVRKEYIWFKTKKAERSCRSMLEKILLDPQFTYLVFQAPVMTLRLHDDGLTHTDLCPENIHFLSNESVTHLVLSDQDFLPVKMLKSTQLRLGFYGAVGLHSCKPLGHDLYRSPEAAFGINFGPPGDIFTAGIVLAEMLLGRQLFQECESGPYYCQENAHQYDAILGAFNDASISKINQYSPGVFNSSMEVADQNYLATEVLEFVACARPVDMVSGRQHQSCSGVTVDDKTEREP